jgi:hypothetical protein
VTGFHARVAVVAGGGGWEGGDTIKVTGTFVLDRFPTLMVIVSLLVPAASPLVLAPTVSCAVLVMDVVASETVSQEALSESVKVV